MKVRMMKIVEKSGKVLDAKVMRHQAALRRVSQATGIPVKALWYGLEVEGVAEASDGRHLFVLEPVKG